MAMLRHTAIDATGNQRDAIGDATLA